MSPTIRRRQIGPLLLFARVHEWGMATYGVVLRGAEVARPRAVVRLERGRDSTGRLTWVWLWAALGERQAGITIPEEIDGLDLPMSRWSVGPVTVYVDTELAGGSSR